MSDRKKHYEQMGISPWMVVNTWPIEQQIGVYRFSALKYIMRLGHKDESAQEVQKGIDSMQELLKVLDTLEIKNMSPIDTKINALYRARMDALDTAP